MKKLFAILAIAGLFIVGCADEQAPVNTNDTTPIVLVKHKKSSSSVDSSSVSTTTTTKAVKKKHHKKKSPASDMTSAKFGS